MLPLGWTTDPDFHWGNGIFVIDPDAVDEAARRVETFERAVPGAYLAPRR